MNSKHNPKEDVLIVNGYVVKAEDLSDEAIEVTRTTEDDYKMKVGIGGGTQAMDTVDRSGNLTFSVWEGSGSHKFLMGLQATKVETTFSYKKGGVNMSTIIGTGGRIKSMKPSSSESATVKVVVGASQVV